MPAAQYRKWCDGTVYGTMTKVRMTKVMPFPVSWTAPYAMRRDFTHYLEVKGLRDSNKVYDMARNSYIAIALKLGEKPFFFGDEPSSIDAILFGHIADALASNYGLHTILKEFPTLCEYYSRIMATFFTLKEEGVRSSNPFLAQYGLEIRLPNPRNSAPPKVVEGPDYLSLSSKQNIPSFSRAWERKDFTKRDRRGSADDEDKSAGDKKEVEVQEFGISNGMWLTLSVGSFVIYVLGRNTDVFKS